MKTRALTLLLSLALAASASAQGLMGEMHSDVNDVQMKFIDLAKAIPEANYRGDPAVRDRLERCCCTSRRTTT